jgi:hypothetical protein
MQRNAEGNGCKPELVSLHLTRDSCRNFMKNLDGSRDLRYMKKECYQEPNNDTGMNLVFKANAFIGLIIILYLEN